jgi:DNA-binding LacI/PurR family transcriptional regulator
MARKYKGIVETLEKRVRHGDYALKPFPTDAELAAEMEVNRITSRKAIQRLIDLGLLSRQSNGRVSVVRRLDHDKDPSSLLLAFLHPAYVLLSFDRKVDIWQTGAKRAAGECGATLRPVLYTHWDDSVIRDTLQGFDGVFFMPMPSPIPKPLLELFRKNDQRIVFLGQDLSHLGIHSVRLNPPAFIHRLLDHLAELGHRRIDCFNVRPLDTEIEQRITQWQVWMSAHRMEGRVISDPAEISGWPVDELDRHAHQAMGRLCDNGQFDATALFCTTTDAAIGAMAAFRERHIAVGVDVSVCAVDDRGEAPYVHPSLTTIEMPDPAIYLSLCMKRIADKTGAWHGSLLIQPEEVKLFRGESTGVYPSGESAADEIRPSPLSRSAE